MRRRLADMAWTWVGAADVKFETNAAEMGRRECGRRKEVGGGKTKNPGREARGQESRVRLQLSANSMPGPTALDNNRAENGAGSGGGAGGKHDVTAGDRRNEAARVEGGVRRRPSAPGKEDGEVGS